jgi:hypothetical protein
MAQMRYYPCIDLEELRKITEHLKQDTRYPDRKSILTLSKHESRTLPLNQPVR